MYQNTQGTLPYEQNHKSSMSMPGISSNQLNR